MKLQPQLAKDHPGYFGVVLALLLMHGGFAVDTLTRFHGTAFNPLRVILGGSLVVYAIMHILCCLLIIWGLYVPSRFILVRMGSALSIITFNLVAITFTISAFENSNISFSLAIAFFGLSGISYLAVKEPQVNPASADRLFVDTMSDEQLHAVGLYRKSDG